MRGYEGYGIYWCLWVGTGVMLTGRLRGLQGATGVKGGYRWLQVVTGGFIWLRVVMGWLRGDGWMRLVTSGYGCLRMVTGGYVLLRVVMSDYRGKWVVTVGVREAPF